MQSMSFEGAEQYQCVSANLRCPPPPPPRGVVVKEEVDSAIKHMSSFSNGQGTEVTQGTVILCVCVCVCVHRCITNSWDQIRVLSNMETSHNQAELLHNYLPSP